MDVIKMLLGISGHEQDGLLSFLIDESKNMILGYCKINEIPAQLESLVPVIAADMYRAKGYGSEAPPEDVKSISEGERSVSYENNRPSGNFLASYRARLAPFKNRKGRVPSDLDLDI